MMAEDPTTSAIVSAHIFSWRLVLFSRGINNPELCAVWSNFEIADMNLWRGEIYTKYFEHLEASGGFYYEASTYT